MIKKLVVLPHQRQFIESTSISTALVGGYGSGKSMAGVSKTILKKLQYPTIDVAYFLPDYPLVRDIAFQKFPEAVSNLGFEYTLNKSDKELHIKGYGKIMFRNLSQPETIIGFEVCYSCIDEIDTLPKSKAKDVYQKILARTRAKLPDGKPNCVDLVSTPEGFRFLYEHFVTNKNDSQLLIKAKTTDNPFLPDGYIETLKQNYDEQLLKQYLDGEFINLNSSNVYYQFNRDTHVVENRDIDTKRPLIISLDFNINPYSSILLIQEIENITYVIDSITEPNMPVMDCVKFLKDKYAHLGDYLYHSTIYGDASGNARSQGTGISNYNLFREGGFHNMRIKTVNPRIVDRVNLVNSRLKNGKGDVRLKVCARNTKLITDLEQLSYDNKGMIDKSDQDLSHTSDALGYYVEYVFEIVKQKTITGLYYWEYTTN